MIRNIIFDFDGVLCESVNIKSDAFYEMYLPYGKDVANKVKTHHIMNGGMSRFDKFEYYANEFLDKPLLEKEKKALSCQFSGLVKKKVIEASFVDGAFRFLADNYSKYKLFIVSGTPMDEMKEIAKEKGIVHYFVDIFGSPQGKVAWCQHIIGTFSIRNNETLFVGDALSDYKAATENGMPFLLRKTEDNECLFSEKLPFVNDMTTLGEYILSLE